MAGREVGEARKRLGDEPDESAPFVGYARALLGELKADMAYAGLQQGVRRRSIGGAQIEVSSVFGQDEIKIIAPTDEGDSKRERPVTDNFQPYLWVGARFAGEANGTIHLFVWEPGEHERITDSIVSSRSVYPTSTYGPTSTFPLGNLEYATVSGKKVYYNANRLIAYADATDKDGVQWKQVVVGDDDIENPEMYGFKTKLVDGTYQVACCLSGSDCDETKGGSVEIKVIAGKGKYRTTFIRTFPIKSYTAYGRAIYPYGYYAQTTDSPTSPVVCSPLSTGGDGYCRVYDMACLGDVEQEKDNGPNPHWDNWMDGCISVVLPGPNESLHIETTHQDGSVYLDEVTPLRVASISPSASLPDGFEPGSAFGDKIPSCEPNNLGYLIPFHSVWVTSLYVNGDSSYLYVCCDWDLGTAIPMHEWGHAFIVDEIDTIRDRGIRGWLEDRFDTTYYKILGLDAKADYMASIPETVDLVWGNDWGNAPRSISTGPSPFGGAGLQDFTSYFVTVIPCDGLPCDWVGGGYEYKNAYTETYGVGTIIGSSYPEGHGYPDNSGNVAHGFVTSGFPTLEDEIKSWLGGIDVDFDIISGNAYTSRGRISSGTINLWYDSRNKVWQSFPYTTSSSGEHSKKEMRYAADNRLQITSTNIRGAYTYKMCQIDMYAA